MSALKNTLTIFSFIIHTSSLWAIPIAFISHDSCLFLKESRGNLFSLFHSACHCFDICSYCLKDINVCQWAEKLQVTIVCILFTRKALFWENYT